MQTFGRSCGAHSVMLPHALVVLLCVAMVLLLGSCQMSQVVGVEQTESNLPNACETVYALATEGSTALADASIPLSHRYISALDVPQSWTQVAIECPRRFAEASLRSAQTHYRLDSMAGILGVDTTGVPIIDFQALSDVEDDYDMVKAMSLAEDRAGFAMGLLAARGSGRQALEMSDEHKTAAQQLLLHSGSDEDPRQKVYTVSELLAHPDTITDPATGLKLPTTAVVEIGCVREELAAVDGESGADSPENNENPPEGNDPDTATTGQAAAQAHNLNVLSRLVSSRTYTAFTYGYPHTDAVLFVQS